MLTIKGNSLIWLIAVPHIVIDPPKNICHEGISPKNNIDREMPKKGTNRLKGRILYIGYFCNKCTHKPIPKKLAIIIL